MHNEADAGGRTPDPSQRNFDQQIQAGFDSSTRQISDKQLEALLRKERSAYARSLLVTVAVRIGLPIVCLALAVAEYVTAKRNLAHDSGTWGFLCFLAVVFSVSIVVDHDLIPSRRQMLLILELSRIPDHRTIPCLLRGLHCTHNAFLFLPGDIFFRLWGVLEERVLALPAHADVPLDYATSRYVYDLLDWHYRGIATARAFNYPFAISLLGIDSVARFWRTRRLVQRIAERTPTNDNQREMKEAAKKAIDFASGS